MKHKLFLGLLLLALTLSSFTGVVVAQDTTDFEESCEGLNGRVIERGEYLPLTMRIVDVDQDGQSYCIQEGAVRIRSLLNLLNDAVVLEEVCQADPQTCLDIARVLEEASQDKDFTPLANHPEGILLEEGTQIEVVSCRGDIFFLRAHYIGFSPTNADARNYPGVTGLWVMYDPNPEVIIWFVVGGESQVPFAWDVREGQTYLLPRSCEA